MHHEWQPITNIRIFSNYVWESGPNNFPQYHFFCRPLWRLSISSELSISKFSSRFWWKKKKKTQKNPLHQTLYNFFYFGSCQNFTLNLAHKFHKLLNILSFFCFVSRLFHFFTFLSPSLPSPLLIFGLIFFFFLFLFFFSTVHFSFFFLIEWNIDSSCFGC